MTTANKKPRPASLILLMGLLVFLGLGALFGGYNLVADPTGGRLQIPLTQLEGTPFSDYLIPGLILFTVLGIFPLFTAYALWQKPSWSFLAGLERLTHQHWSWLASLTVGIALVIWIIVQGMILGFGHPLQVIYLLLGFVIIGVTFLPSVRRYYARDEQRSSDLGQARAL
jgi:hypothetical protein